MSASSTSSGKCSLNLASLRTFHSSDSRARRRRSESARTIEPAVHSFSTMKLTRPVRIVDAFHAGFQSSGWKSVKLMQIRAPGSKRPDGVVIHTDGGLKGYWGGNLISPW